MISRYIVRIKDSCYNLSLELRLHLDKDLKVRKGDISSGEV